MTTVTDDAGQTQTSWRLVNVVLIVLALALVATTVFFFVQEAQASSEESDATSARPYTAVRAAATKETLAFLSVDYRDMDARIEKVLAGATGTFKEQYSGARANLKTSATTAQAVSTGKVLAVGVSDLDEKSAAVFVAANSSVTNKSTQGKPKARYYRLKLSMVRERGRWLTSDIQFVG